MNDYWNNRFREEGKIWGEEPSRSAVYALDLFQKNDVKKVVVPGSGYGRNTKLFSAAGMKVSGVEISEIACKMARKFDPASRFYNDSALDMSVLAGNNDAVFCFNVLHLFPQYDRTLLINQCLARIKRGGVMFFTVFSEKEASFGKGKSTELYTYESKKGRPVHYFTEEDLKTSLKRTEILEMGEMEEAEDHGEGPHTHILRFIYVKKIK
jgi:SAM-dependent methyltransferase